MNYYANIDYSFLQVIILMSNSFLLLQNAYVTIASVPKITKPYIPVDPCTRDLLNNGQEVSNQMDEEKDLLGDKMEKFSSKVLNNSNHPKDRSKARSNIERLIQASKGSFISMSNSNDS